MRGLLAATLLTCALPSSAAKVKTKSILSDVYKIDRLYKSMEGPFSVRPITLGGKDRPGELIWLTGIRTTMMDSAGKKPTRAEFMCHVNLDFNLEHRNAQTENLQRTQEPRIFTLSQGQTEVVFPKGFGMPMLSNESLLLTTQVLNHNDKKADFDVRHKVDFEFLEDQEAQRLKLRPLRKIGIWGMARISGPDGHYGFPAEQTEHHGKTCMEGDRAGPDMTRTPYQDQFKREFTGHWVVKPGREVNHTNVTHQLKLPYDTTLHYVAVHLHPFAESLELRDRTTGKAVFHSRVGWAPDGRIGLSRVDYLSSREGVPLYSSHEYELISVYNNTSGEDQDSMAVMHLFVLDKELDDGPTAGR